MLRIGLSLSFSVVLAVAASANDFTVQLELAGKKLQGRVVQADKSLVHLLGRDGRLWEFEPTAPKKFAKIADGFQPYSAAEMRAQLLREFGGQFDCTGTGHYLVVHPAKQRDLWAERFEDLYRSYVHYFTARGLTPKPPAFPMVAVVLPRQADFLDYARREGVQANASILGYYSYVSNRVITYDVTAGKPKSEEWYVNAETIIHEATHQTAFNTGLHSRFTPPPRWLSEGLAQMFEAKGVWNSQRYGNRSDRLNAYRLESFRKYAFSRRKKGAIPELVSFDRMFNSDADGAYSEAWALAFFLMETEPNKFGKYLSLTAAAPPFEPYSPSQRLKDFTDVFGANLAQLEARFLRFVDEL